MKTLSFHQKAKSPQKTNPHEPQETDLKKHLRKGDIPRGFRFSAVSAGIKASGRLDLALVEAPPDATAAALFTTNRVVAAPVFLGRRHLAATRGRIRAVIVNAGNANCATGKQGLRACQHTCNTVARLMNVRSEEVFPSSTGIIGVPLPVEKIVASLPRMVESFAHSEKAVSLFAQAIMTTDTRRKIAVSHFASAKNAFKLLGVAKGTGMIHPQLATMLVYLFTDAIATPAQLRRCLQPACEQSFNRISIDGDTSTNDTVLLLASGQSAFRLTSAPARRSFASALTELCRSLAGQILADGEGVKHVIRIVIERAKSHREGLQVAKTVAHSLLVKTSWAGADPNWGRILAAVGRSGVPVDPDRIDIRIGKQMVCISGHYRAFDEARAHRELRKKNCEVRICLHRGRSEVTFFTTDLSAEYVRINADYAT
ncbi:MAG: bifunctional glutamate N-acetyltransferase/amino-acid acetyltransferase ArgJ [Acidobacteriota bacterium]|nr:bifunctional glutamate N-acetyltransferase/amino-acid acetyltransferase ArgJ [Acidobacteriota bacterium]